MSIDLADQLVPIAAQLIGTVHDFGPDDVAAVLARVPEGRHDALAVILAAMVDPDASPRDLLAWTTRPVQSRDFMPPGFEVSTLSANDLGRRAERRAEVARLSLAGLTVQQISDRLGITTRSVNRHRTAIRASVGKAS